MSNFISLTKIQIKDFLGKAASGLNVKNNKLGKLLQLIILAVLAVPAVTFTIVTYDTFAAINQPELVITSMYVNSTVLMFFFGIPLIISVFFFSRDMDFLAALPVREETIVFAKLTTVYIYLLGITALLMGPALVIYIINVGFDIILLLLSLLALVLAPVLPLLLSAILVLIFSRLISFSRYRNTLTVLGNIILVIAIIWLQLNITKYTSQPHQLQQAYKNGEGMLGLIGMSFPPSIWMTRMVLGSFVDTVYFLTSSIFTAFVLQVLAKSFFRSSISSFGQGVSRTTGNISYSQKSKGWQLIKRNINIILKEPTFLMNTVLSMLVPILIFVINSFTGEFSANMFASPQMKPYIPLIFSGILISPTVIGNISATAITREGAAFWETKVLPLSSEENIRYRIITTLIFNYAGSALLLLVSLFVIPISPGVILLAVYFCITVTLFLSHVDIIINIYRPLLNWTNPTAAVKNNLNVMISLAIRVVVALVYYLLYIAIPGIFSSFELVILISGFIFFTLYIITRIVIYRFYVGKFQKISI